MATPPDNPTGDTARDTLLPPVPQPQPSARPAVRAPLTLDDLTADLLWPKLLRAPLLGLNPTRIAIALVGLVIIGLIFWLTSMGDRAATGSTILEFWLPVRSNSPYSTTNADWLWTHTVLQPLRCVRAAPISTFLGVPAAVAVYVLAAGAISRMAAVEFARAASLGPIAGLRFAFTHAPSLIGAALAPFVLVWLIAAVLALLGLLFRIPVLNVLTAIAYPVLLLLGCLATVAMALLLLAKPLLIPAVTCDGADAFDAIQRAYAYVIARPARLLVHLAVLILTLAAAVAVVLLLARWAVGFTALSTSLGAGETGGAALIHGTLDDGLVRRTGADPAQLAGSARLASRIVSYWTITLYALVAAYIFSAATAGATVLYLLVRRINDGQDVSDLWEAGAFAGGMRERPVGSDAPGTR